MPRKPMPRTPMIDRLLAKVVERDECWIFTGTHTANGYGRIHGPGKEAKTFLTHRVTYEYFIGSIPDGLDLDHLCRVRDCCNPWHLEPVTRRVNLRRGSQCSKPKCLRGHDYDYIDSSGHRICKQCKAINWQRYANRLKEAS